MARMRRRDMDAAETAAARARWSGVTDHETLVHLDDAALRDARQTKVAIVGSGASAEATRIFAEALESSLAWDNRPTWGYAAAFEGEFAEGPNLPIRARVRLDGDPHMAVWNAVRTVERKGGVADFDLEAAYRLLELCRMYRDAAPMVAAAIGSGFAMTMLEVVATTREERSREREAFCMAGK